MSNRRVLITGGSQGIGLAIARAFLSQGDAVVVVSRTANEALIAAGARQFSLDLADTRLKDIRLSLEADILINCAGQKLIAESEVYPPEWFEQDWRLMVNAPFLLSQAIFPYMKAKSWGRIVNICSISSFQGARYSAGYVSAKHALLGLTRALATEWGIYGVTVNAIAPGFIDTHMLIHAPDLPRIPLGRIGAPEEIATAVIFLCSEEAKYITGICMPVDGGWLAR